MLEIRTLREMARPFVAAAAFATSLGATTANANFHVAAID
jgi:hypothetical protein